MLPHTEKNGKKNNLKQFISEKKATDGPNQDRQTLAKRKNGLNFDNLPIKNYDILQTRMVVQLTEETFSLCFRMISISVLNSEDTLYYSIQYITLDLLNGHLHIYG